MIDVDEDEAAQPVRAGEQEGGLARPRTDGRNTGRDRLRRGDALAGRAAHRHGAGVTDVTVPATLPAPTASDEVDSTLLAWYRELSLVERLRAASRAAATLERLARAASANR